MCAINGIKFLKGIMKSCIIYICMHVCMCVCMYVVYIYVRTYVRMYVFMYVRYVCVLRMCMYNLNIIS